MRLYVRHFLYAGIVFLLFTHMDIRPSFADELRLQGVSLPNYNAQLSFPIPGVVGEIAVRAGQRVKTGDLLMRLHSDPEDRRIELVQHEVGNIVKLRILQTRADQAAVDYERYKGALKRQAATDMETQHAHLAHKLTLLELEEEKFRLEQLERSLHELMAHRERMRLYAAVDGYVEEVNVEVGMAVDKNTPALRLVSIDPLTVDFSMPVARALTFKEGEKVTLCFPKTTTCREGLIRHIGKIAILSSGNLRVRVQSDNPQNTPAGMMLEAVFGVTP